MPIMSVYIPMEDTMNHHRGAPVFLVGTFDEASPNICKPDVNKKVVSISLPLVSCQLMEDATAGVGVGGGGGRK